jgi:CBS domain-containing protein
VPPPLLIAATLDVLRRHAPFDAMQAPALERLAARLKLRYFAAGDVVLAPAAGRVECLHIIQRGEVLGGSPHAGTFHATALSLTAGECFPIGALIGRRATTLQYTAATDCFCYLLDEAGFLEAMETSPEFRDFCTFRLGQMLGESHKRVGEAFASRASAELGMGSPLRAAVRRAALTLPEDAPLREALRLMKDKRVGSVVLTDSSGAPSGIFTHTDVLDRVALAGVALDRPMSEVMTRDPVSLPAGATVAEAAQRMARHGFRHLLVMDEGRLSGVLSERDLFALQRRSVQGLRKEIARARDEAELAFVARDVLGLAGALLAQGLAAEPLTQLVTALNDALAARAIELALEPDALPGIAWCWMGLGSEGRMEQTLATDQDNAIVFADPGAGQREAVRLRLLAFAGRVNGLLAASGFPLCRGDIMARNPRWCLTLPEWRELFDDWMRNADPEALLNAAIFFDFRALAGDASLADALREFLLANVARRPAFLRQMAANALQTRPPLGFFNHIAVGEGSGGMLDLKRQASRPFVDAARILALAAGIGATNTAERLRGAGPKLRMSEDEVAAGAQAFHFVQMLRLRRQEEKPGGEFEHRNRVDPETLNSLDRRILKEALRQARKLQNRLAADYQL